MTDELELLLVLNQFPKDKFTAPPREDSTLSQLCKHPRAVTLGWKESVAELYVPDKDRRR
jgi:hypothetical protein